MSHAEDAIDPKSHNGMLLVLSKTYMPEKLAELESLLDDAKKQAAGDPVVIKCIEFLSQAIRYAKVDTAFLRAYFSSGSKDKKQRVLDALDARQEVMLDIYDNHFYAQNPLYPLLRERSMFKKYG